MTRSFIIKELSEAAGVKVIRCDKEWGGTFGYELPDGCKHLGYINETHALSDWAKEYVGDKIINAIVKLVKK